MASFTSSSNALTPPSSLVSSPNAPTPDSSPPDEFDRGLSLSFQSSLGCSEAEPVEDYRPWGFHPVHFGDLFHHGQYKIVRKLGFGAFSTAWLAKDTLNSHYVAVKIKTAKTSEDMSELSILSYLSQQRNSDWMSRHTITILDCFQHQGPNGKRVCIVSEALSASVSSVLTNTFKYFNGVVSLFPKWMAKRIIRQVLIGLCFLHSHGVIHGGIHLNNVLFEVPNLASYTGEELEHDKSKDVQLVTRPDGTPDECAPRYIPVAWPLIEHFCNGPGFTVKITDLDGAFLSTDISKNPDTPRCLRAPEQLFDSPLDQTIDIWSFGCLVYELLTGCALMMLEAMGKTLGHFKPIVSASSIVRQNQSTVAPFSIYGPLCIFPLKEIVYLFSSALHYHYILYQAVQSTSNASRRILSPAISRHGGFLFR